MDFDLIIHHGEVLDGTGGPRQRTDVGVRGDRIAAVGDLAGALTEKSLKADGLCVAPGFVDVHNHSDGWMLRCPHLLAKTRQGFTTEVLAADGISYAPANELTGRQWLYYLRALDGLRADQGRPWRTLADFMQEIDGHNVQNAATHIPYANVRSLVCGWKRHSVDDFQMRQIQYEIQRGMDQGAVGLSTGLDYIVQCFSTTDELVEACSAMARHQGLYVTHMRYKKGVLAGLREAVEIGRRANVPVHISHLKGESPAHAEAILQYIDQTARHEVDLSFDVYPYQPGSTMLSYLLPYEVWEDGPLAALDKLSSPQMQQRFDEGLQAYRLDLERIRLAWLPGRENADQLGKTLAQYIRDQGGRPAQVLLDLLIEERMAVLCVMDEGDDALARPFLQHDLFMLGSDGIYHPDGPVHPRVYGSASRLLGRCVRDWRLFSLEQAVHKLSGRPAERFGLADRGTIQPGRFADLVVFDEHSVTDRATYEQPHQLSEGIKHLLVNGTLVLLDQQPLETSRLPGRFVRREK